MTRFPHLRWWQWTLSAALLPLAGIELVVLIEQHLGAVQYQHVLADLHAAGRPTTLAEYKALAPPIDATLQDDWTAWSTRFTGFNVPLDYSETREWSAWIYGRRSQPPEKTVANLAVMRPLMAEARALLKRGPPLMSTFVWVARDLPLGKRAIDENDYNSFMQSFPNLLIIRIVAEWLRRDALIATDPAEDLGGLDRLIQGLSCPGAIIDAMIALAIEDIRNRCYLELAMVGRLPAAPRARWLEAPTLEMAEMADAYRGERLILIPYFVSLYSRFLPIIATGEDRNAWSLLLAWPTRLQDCAIETDIDARLEARLRDGAAAAPLDGADIKARLASIGGFAENIPLWYFFAIEADANHRLVRLAVRLLELANSGTALPASAGEAQSLMAGLDLFHPAGDRLPVLYRRLAADRFCVCVDPAGPFPSFYEPARLITYSSPSGRTTSDEPLILNKLFIEMLVPPSGSRDKAAADRP
jgi:hypothetical protein